MAKKKKDRPGIIVRKNRIGVAPVSPYDAEQLDAVKEGAEFDLVPRTKRSLPQLRVYWKALTDVCEATGKWSDAYNLHRALLYGLGYVSIAFRLDGTPYVEIDSIALDDMEEPVFQRYMDSAMARLGEVVGYDPLHFMEAAA